MRGEQDRFPICGWLQFVIRTVAEGSNGDAPMTKRNSDSKLVLQIRNNIKL